MTAGNRGRKIYRRPNFGILLVLYLCTTKTCEHFQHLKSLMELFPDEQNSDQTLETNLCDLAFYNFVIIDKADHWSPLLYKETLAIRRHKPRLNHGTKATRELVIFY